MGQLMYFFYVLVVVSLLIACGESSQSEDSDATGQPEEQPEAYQEEMEIENFLSFVEGQIYECIAVLEGSGPNMVGSQIKFTRDSIIWHYGTDEETVIPIEVEFIMEDYNDFLFAGGITAIKKNGKDTESIIVIDESLLSLSWFAEAVKFGFQRVE